MHEFKIPGVNDNASWMSMSKWITRDRCWYYAWTGPWCSQNWNAPTFNRFSGFFFSFPYSQNFVWVQFMASCSHFYVILLCMFSIKRDGLNATCCTVSYAVGRYFHRTQLAIHHQYIHQGGYVFGVVCGFVSDSKQYCTKLTEPISMKLSGMVSHGPRKNILVQIWIMGRIQDSSFTFTNVALAEVCTRQRNTSQKSSRWQ